MAVDGDTAVVTAATDTVHGEINAGSAYVFFRSGTVWTLQAKLTAPDGLNHDYFGISVALDGDTVVIGAYGDDTPAGTDAGSAYSRARREKHAIVQFSPVRSRRWTKIFKLL